MDHMRPFSIGFAKDIKNGKPLYYAFAAKTEEDLLKINGLVAKGMTMPSEHDFKSLTVFYVLEADPRAAAKTIKEELAKRGWISQIDPMAFWSSKCPWLMN